MVPLNIIIEEHLDHIYWKVGETSTIGKKLPMIFLVFDLMMTIYNLGLCAYDLLISKQHVERNLTWRFLSHWICEIIIKKL